MPETYVKILQRVDTKENWEINNPILLDKEIGYERETGKYKIGDGIKQWNELSYNYSETGSNNGITFSISEEGLLTISKEDK